MWTSYKLTLRTANRIQAALFCHPAPKGLIECNFDTLRLSARGNLLDVGVTRTTVPFGAAPPALLEATDDMCAFVITGKGSNRRQAMRHPYVFINRSGFREQDTVFSCGN
ncbi:hypothetical protein RRG08_043738 [Elysia crispata]|uniref:Uncharacterized protein n=1 Tax=Elysia crispata TaxID=231223 RepID=A0AAE0ZN49_9GAST|nr:hypothetical protein RRG08_043738 [Elysia crispata]